MALSHEKKKELERGQPYRRELCDLTQLRELKPEYLWRDMQKRRKAVCPEEPTKKISKSPGTLSEIMWS